MRTCRRDASGLRLKNSESASETAMNASASAANIWATDNGASEGSPTNRRQPAERREGLLGVGVWTADNRLLLVKVHERVRPDASRRCVPDEHTDATSLHVVVDDGRFGRAELDERSAVSVGDPVAGDDATVATLDVHGAHRVLHAVVDDLDVIAAGEVHGPPSTLEPVLGDGGRGRLREPDVAEVLDHLVAVDDMPGATADIDSDIPPHSLEGAAFDDNPLDAISTDHADADDRTHDCIIAFDHDVTIAAAAGDGGVRPLQADDRCGKVPQPRRPVEQVHVFEASARLQDDCGLSRTEDRGAIPAHAANGHAARYDRRPLEPTLVQLNDITRPGPLE